jgi:hypothetical protein
MNIKFPTLIVDNFFNDPDVIINLSNTLEFFEADKKEFWPGKRSLPLHTVNDKLFNFILSKVLSFYYDFQLESVSWENAYVAFHKMNSKIDLKDIHKDNSALLAGIIYLNKNGTIDNGTTIYNEDKNKKLILSNTYNTMLSYDANQLHGATSTIMYNNEERLSIVFFIDTLIAYRLPMERSIKYLENIRF